MSATLVEAPASTRSASMPLLTGALLATVGSLGYIALNSLPPREASLHPVGVGSAAVTTIGCLLLGMGLLQWRTPLPRWAVVAAATGVWFAGATAWALSTFVVAAARGTTNAHFDALFFNSPWVLGGMAVKSLLCFPALLGLAIAGWRQRSIPRVAALALGLAALLSLWPPYPPGLIVTAIACGLIARPRRAGALSG